MSTFLNILSKVVFTLIVSAILALLSQVVIAFLPSSWTQGEDGELKPWVKTTNKVALTVGKVVLPLFLIVALIFFSMMLFI